MHINYADRDALAKFVKADGSGSATVTIPATKDQFHCIDWITWSCSDDPSPGSLKISIGGVDVWDIDITVGGPGHLEFERPLHTNARQGPSPKGNEEVVITLTCTGANGKLNVRYR